MHFLTIVLVLVASGLADAQWRCAGRYRQGERWAKVDEEGLSYECTCFVDKWGAHSQCVLRSCEFEGSVHQVGETWYTRDRQLRCSCRAHPQGTEGSCVPVSAGNQPKCEGRYGDGERWVKKGDGVYYECTCSVRDRWATYSCVVRGGTKCRFGTVTYNVGDTWTLHEGGYRRTCRCYVSGAGTHYACH